MDVDGSTKGATDHNLTNRALKETRFNVPGTISSSITTIRNACCGFSWGGLTGGARRTRTSDLEFRKLLLYPPEL